MKKKASKISFWRLGTLLGLVFLLLVGLFSLGVVWFRMEISEVAKLCGKLEDERERVNRRLRDLRGQRSAVMRPTRLAHMVAGRLEKPPPAKQFYVTPEDMRRRLSDNLDLPTGASERGTIARNFGQ